MDACLGSAGLADGSNGHDAEEAVHGEDLSGPDQRGGIGNAGDAGKAVLAGNDGAVLVYMTVWFVIALMKRRNDIVDVAWGPGFILAAAASLVVGGVYASRGLLLSLLVLVWGIRLTMHIHARNRGKVLEARVNVLNRAYQTHPERFVNGAPTPTPLLEAVWINPPPSIHNRGETVFTNFLTAVSQSR